MAELAGISVRRAGSNSNDQLRFSRGDFSYSEIIALHFFAQLRLWINAVIFVWTSWRITVNLCGIFSCGTSNCDIQWCNMHLIRKRPCVVTNIASTFHPSTLRTLVPLIPLQAAIRWCTIVANDTGGGLIFLSPRYIFFNSGAQEINCRQFAKTEKSHCRVRIAR